MGRGTGTLAVQHEVGAYVELHRAVFGSPNMTVEWRTRTLCRPEYLSDLDLVAVAPDGSLAGFCICWIDRGTAAVGQVEPLGVHERWRGRGLGRALLAEGLRRLADHGAIDVYVETDSYRDAARDLYESAGFEVARDVLVFRRDL